MASNIKVLITTGDTDGVGWEVTAKSLAELGPQKNVQFYYFKSSKQNKAAPLQFKKYESSLNRRFNRKTITSINLASSILFDPNTLVEIQSSESPAHWIEQAANACMKKQFSALVTAPLSKTSIVNAGFKDLGHTEILARVSGTKFLFMGFIGKKFSVLLATGHMPLSRVSKALSASMLQSSIEEAQRLKSFLSPTKSHLPLALVGLNPHAGEAGLIGSEEALFSMVIDLLPSSIEIDGPIPGDSAFLPLNWSRYSVFICPYHDQGLIPFKMVHGFSNGVHLTLGLPFLRTSVDHGTAKELFGKNKAEHGSMKDAILTAIRLNKRGLI